MAYRPTSTGLGNCSTKQRREAMRSRNTPSARCASKAYACRNLLSWRMLGSLWKWGREGAVRAQSSPKESLLQGELAESGAVRRKLKLLIPEEPRGVQPALGRRGLSRCCRDRPESGLISEGPAWREVTPVGAGSRPAASPCRGHRRPAAARFGVRRRSRTLGGRLFRSSGPDDECGSTH